MALIFADGFDTYGGGATNSSDAWVYGPWTGQLNSNNYAGNSFTRFGSGLSYQLGGVGNASGMYKTLSANTTNTIYCALATYTLGTLDGFNGYYYYISFDQGGTNQVSVQWYRNGNINVFRNGTLIATFSAAHSAQVWTHWQIKIVIDPSAGEVRIRKNGDTSDTFAATGLNTRATANAYVDKVNMLDVGSGSLWDDFVFLDSSGSVNNTWTGDVRCHTLLPSGAGSSNNFTAQGGGGFQFNGSTFQNFYDANYIRVATFYAPFTMSLDAVGAHYAAAASGNIVAGIWSDNAGIPGTLIATSSVLTNVISGVNKIPFSSPPTITAGTKYWVGFNANFGIGMFTIGGSAGHQMFYTYNGSLPTTIAVSSAFSPMFTLYPVSSGGSAAIITPDGDLSYASDSTAGDHDLFAMTNLPATPTSIMAVQQRVVARRTDGGPRALQTELKSGATTVQGTATSLSTSYVPQFTIYETDPNTGSAWTASAVNALEAGYKISS